jgi:hypothetical protein
MPWTINVSPAEHGNMISKELQRDDFHDWLQEHRRFRYTQNSRYDLLHFSVILAHNRKHWNVPLYKLTDTDERLSIAEQGI